MNINGMSTPEERTRYYRHRDAMFEIMRAWGVDVENWHCPDGLCDGGRGCPRSEEGAIEVFAELWELDDHD